MTTHHILAAGRGVAHPLRRGDRAVLNTPDGTQVVDTWALALDDPLEYAAMEHTRSVNSSIFLERGMRAVSIHRRPMLLLEDDATPGRHDTLLCPCNAAIYRELGCTGLHRSCTDNFHEAIAAHGLTLPFTPASLNLFMNVPVAPDGTVDRLPPAATPGQHVTLRAEMDLLLVLSACPQDVTPINGADHTPRDVHLTLIPAGDPA